ncbi:Elf1 protein [Hanseniaspora uvarum]|nr:Elf1 protein [Hanseniaspora uvarum]
MAKKKSSRKPVKKVRVVLDTSFDCPFCNHNKCITVSVDKRISMIGTLHCNKCNVSFETKVNVLSDPVDVYTDWIDAVEAVNDPKALNDSGSRKEIDSDSDSDLYDTDDDVETDKKSAVVDDEGESDFSEADDNSNQNLTSDEEDIEDQHVVKKRKIVIEDDEE